MEDILRRVSVNGYENQDLSWCDLGELYVYHQLALYVHDIQNVLDQTSNMYLYEQHLACLESRCFDVISRHLHIGTLSLIIYALQQILERIRRMDN